VVADAASFFPALQSLSTPVRRRQARAWAWAGLATLMLLAQMLGLWHGLAHPLHGVHPAVEGLPRQAAGHLHDEGVEHAAAHTAAHTAAHADTSAHGVSWLQQIFEGDEHAASCVLYDQLAHADGLPSLPLLWLPPAWVPAVPPWHARWQLAAQATGFLARGPPSRA
jgi:hypothetical protein